MEKFVVILRHGIAEPRGSAPEETRPLTEEGHKRMKEIGRGLANLFPKAEAILTSPLKRCVQTAEWVVKAYPNLPLVTSDLLRPEADSSAMRQLINSTNLGRFILCGHESNLTEGMLQLTRTHTESELELKKGGCYGVRITDDGHASLEWMLPPRVLRAVQ
jgi:phosphohistidine phosphatase